MSTTRDKDTEAAFRLSVTKQRAIDAFVEGCAHRDKQTIAYLRERAKELEHIDIVRARAYATAANEIRLGEHVK
jgi:hypothetical protein